MTALLTDFVLALLQAIAALLVLGFTVGFLLLVLVMQCAGALRAMDRDKGE
ncbi:MAG: hypothetical protein AB7J63_09875 [Vicinamibacterales bacterium]